MDYVRSTAGGIAELTRALTDVGERLGFDVRARISEYPKVRWRTTSVDGLPIRIKIEVNTHERSPALPHLRLNHSVPSAWWTGDVPVLTFQPAELVATKIRALYQRSKGRDLFDLWLALRVAQIPADDILAAFEPYRPDSFTASAVIANVQAKLIDRGFRGDTEPLLAERPAGYDVDAELIIDTLLSKL